MSSGNNLLVRTESEDDNVFIGPSRSPSLSSIRESFKRTGSTSSGSGSATATVAFRKKNGKS